MFLFSHVLINCNLYTWQLLHTSPVEKAGNFTIQTEKKETLKKSLRTAHHNWTLFLKSISRNFWYIFLFLPEHDPSFTLFLICSYFFIQFELRCSYKVCSYKKYSIICLYWWQNTSHVAKTQNISKLWKLISLTIEEKIDGFKSLAISKIIHLDFFHWNI